MRFFDFNKEIQNDTEFVIFGIPWDYLSSAQNADASEAPSKIRAVTSNLALTTEMGIEIPSLKVIDVGDIRIIDANVELNLKEIDNFISKIYKKKQNVVLVAIGGDHFCTFPVVKSMGKNLNLKDSVGILIFDSHLDLYNEWDKGVYSHATISHRLYDLDFVDNNKLLIVGTRDIDIPELKIANEEHITHYDAFLFSDLGLQKLTNDIINFFKNSKIKQLYVSIDIDVLDPSIAPATGYAIPGGLSYRELWHIMRTLAKNFNIIGFDLVEVAPNLDPPNNVTANLAAKLIIEFISFISHSI
jgi:agmatinase